MPKIVLNKSSYPFKLSQLAILRYLELKSIKPFFYIHSTSKRCYVQTSKAMFLNGDMLITCVHIALKNFGKETQILETFDTNDIARSDKILIQVVQELKDKAHYYSNQNFQIVTIPAKFKYRIVRVIEEGECAINSEQIW